jgi:branched-chain amino acid transport system substrate-binding protein
MSRKQTVVTAVVLAGVLALSGCGGGQEADPVVGDSCDTSKGTLVVGLITPLSQRLSAIGLGMRNSADLAVDQANRECTVPGYALVLQAEDDQAAPQVAAEVAGVLAADPAVVGVIGTFNSSTAQAVQPILDEAGIVQVSPANTGPALTLGEQPTTAPQRPYDTYFRLATTDLAQGPFGARYLVDKAGKDSIAVIDDGKAYGTGLVEQFVLEAERLGATIVARERVGERDTDFSGVITRIRGLDPDAVYYGGEYPVAGPLSAQLGAAGLDIPLMGGDGIINEEYVPLGGRQGDLGTSIGAPVEDLPSAQGFVAAYEAANYAEGFAAYGALSYDAANVIIDALAQVLATGDWSSDRRAEVVAAVQATRAEGASGPIAFDEFGDTTNKLLTVNEVEGDGFVPRETGVFDEES